MSLNDKKHQQVMSFFVKSIKNDYIGDQMKLNSKSWSISWSFNSSYSCTLRSSGVVLPLKQRLSCCLCKTNFVVVSLWRATSKKASNSMILLKTISYLHHYWSWSFHKSVDCWQSLNWYLRKIKNYSYNLELYYNYV